MSGSPSDFDSSARHEEDGSAVTSPPPPPPPLSSPPQLTAARPRTASSKIQKPSNPRFFKTPPPSPVSHVAEGDGHPPPIRRSADPGEKYRYLRTRPQAGTFTGARRGTASARSVDTVSGEGSGRMQLGRAIAKQSPVPHGVAERRETFSEERRRCDGAEGGTRTHTRFPPPDFESGASASSATSAGSTRVAVWPTGSRS